MIIAVIGNAAASCSLFLGLARSGNVGRHGLITGLTCSPLVCRPGRGCYMQRACFRVAFLGVAFLSVVAVSAVGACRTRFEYVLNANYSPSQGAGFDYITPSLLSTFDLCRRELFLTAFRRIVSVSTWTRPRVFLRLILPLTMVCTVFPLPWASRCLLPARTRAWKMAFPQRWSLPIFRQQLPPSHPACFCSVQGILGAIGMARRQHRRA